MNERQRKEIRKIIELSKNHIDLCLYSLELDEENDTPQTFEQAVKELRDVLKDIDGLLNQAKNTFKE